MTAYQLALNHIHLIRSGQMTSQQWRDAYMSHYPGYYYERRDVGTLVIYSIRRL